MAQAVSPAPYRFSRLEYDRLAEEGFFEGKKVELLDGVIVTMSPQNSSHAGTVNRILYVLMERLGASAIIRSQLPIILDDWSEPEPDIAVCRPDPYQYTRSHPTADKVPLVLEVAETSLRYDRGSKAGAYARSGIPTYWIVNLEDRSVEVLAQPDRLAGRYAQREVKTANDPLDLPGGARVTVAELLPHA